MKKILIIFIILLATNNIFSQEIVPGTVVNDPISYKHMLEQIASTTEQIKVAQKTLKEASDLTNEVGKMREGFSNAYNNTFAVFGETKKLIDQLKETPKLFEEIKEDYAKLWGCFKDDLDQYSKESTLYTATYNTTTPISSPFNYGTEPSKAKDYNFGQDIAVQMAERPCGYTKTFKDAVNRDIKIHKKASDTLDRTDPIINRVKKELILGEEKFKEWETNEKKRLESINKVLTENTENDNITTLTAKNKDLLALIYFSLEDIKAILRDTSKIFVNVNENSEISI